MTRAKPAHRFVPLSRAKEGDTVQIAGAPVYIGSADECEEATMLVCVGATIPLYHTDNLTAPCSRCGRIVQFRPSSPKRPPKVCMSCLELELMVTMPTRGNA